MDGRALQEEAVGLHRRGDFGRAEALYRQLLATAPVNIEARYMLAMLCFQQGRADETVRLLDEVLAPMPRFVEALMLKGVALQTMGRPADALTSYDAALAQNPGLADTWTNRGLVLVALGRLPEALASFDAAIARDAHSVEAWNNRASVLEKLKRPAEALQSAEQALAQQPRHTGALFNRAVILEALHRPAEALVGYEHVLALDPQHDEARFSRATIFQRLNRPAESLPEFDMLLARNPHHDEAWTGRGIALTALRRHEEALASFDKALSRRADSPEGWGNRGIALQALERFGEAEASYRKALALAPDHAGVLRNLGSLLCETDRIAEGFAAWQRSAALTPAAEPLEPPAHRARHDAERRAYLADDAQAAQRANGTRLDGAAVNPRHTGEVEAQWIVKQPQIVVIDDFLSPEALEKMRHFCLGAPVWGKTYKRGYLGAFPEHGFTSPILAQIADELRLTYPAIFAGHPLRYAWGFKYDSSLEGISIHADQAAVNVNFWITPDDANRDPEGGGLVIWDVPAPLDWEITKYNGDDAACRAFLAQTGAKPTRVPYRANRAVIFDSDLFHETDEITFKDGYLNRRINVTLLYGRRSRAES